MPGMIPYQMGLAKLKTIKWEELWTPSKEVSFSYSCVSLYYNNSNREKHLKFFLFPNGSSQEKKALRD